MTQRMIKNIHFRIVTVHARKRSSYLNNLHALMSVIKYGMPLNDNDFSDSSFSDHLLNSLHRFVERWPNTYAIRLSTAGN